MDNKSKNDMVNHPKHYTSSATGIEVIEVTRYLTGSLSNAWKYCCRYLHKGTPSQDLRKAVFYLNDFRKKPVTNAYTCTDGQCKDLLRKMDKFIAVEEMEEIKDVLVYIRDIVDTCLTGSNIKENPDRVIGNLAIYADAIEDK